MLTLKFVLGVSLFLSGCTTVYEMPPAPPPPAGKSKYVQELEKFRAEVGKQRADPGLQTLLSCQQAFPRGSDAERLCLLRGFDRQMSPQPNGTQEP